MGTYLHLQQSRGSNDSNLNNKVQPAAGNDSETLPETVNIAATHGTIQRFFIGVYTKTSPVKLADQTRRGTCVLSGPFHVLLN